MASIEATTAVVTKKLDDFGTKFMADVDEKILKSTHDTENKILTINNGITNINNTLSNITVSNNEINKSIVEIRGDVVDIKKEGVIKRKEITELEDQTGGTIQKRDVLGTIAAFVGTIITIGCMAWQLWSVMYSGSEPFFAMLSVVSIPSIYVLAQKLTGQDIKQNDAAHAIEVTKLKHEHEKSKNMYQGIIISRDVTIHSLKEKEASHLEQLKQYKHIIKQINPTLLPYEPQELKELQKPCVDEQIEKITDSDQNNSYQFKLPPEPKNPPQN